MRGMHDRYPSDNVYSGRMPYPRRENGDYRANARPYGRDYELDRYERDDRYRPHQPPPPHRQPHPHIPPPQRHYDYSGPSDRHYHQPRYVDSHQQHPQQHPPPPGHRDHPLPPPNRERSPRYDRIPRPPGDGYERRRYDSRDYGYSRPQDGRGRYNSVRGNQPHYQHPRYPPRGPIRYSYQYPNKVFVGNLGDSVTEADLIHAFEKFGQINKLEYRKKYALVDYQKPRDADVAIYEMNGQNFFGTRLRVQPHCDLNKRTAITREPNSAFQVTVLNMDPEVSWQDLKDFARRAGNVQYASIATEGEARFGLIEYSCQEEVEKAIEQLNDQQLGKNKIELVNCPLNEYLEQYKDPKYERDVFTADDDLDDDDYDDRRGTDNVGDGQELLRGDDSVDRGFDDEGVVVDDYGEDVVGDGEVDVGDDDDDDDNDNDNDNSVLDDTHSVIDSNSRVTRRTTSAKAKQSGVGSSGSIKSHKSTGGSSLLSRPLYTNDDEAIDYD